MLRGYRIVAAVAAAFVVCGVGIAAAQSVWPTRTVTLVVPVPAGGVIDVVARLIGQEMRGKVSQNVVVENKPGATGMIGSEFVARAEPDGNTLVVIGASQSILPNLIPNMKYDPAKDHAPISLLATGAHAVLVPASLPVSNIQELIALLKKEPGKHNYASSGAGAPPHLAAELFKLQAGVDMVHVPYAGTTPALADLIAGRVSVFIDALGPSLGQVAAGQLKVLGVGTRQRVPLFPNIPTLAEQGLPNFESYTWVAIYAPGTTPKPIIDAIHRAVSEAGRSGEVKSKLEALGYQVAISTPEELRAFQAEETKKWGDVIRAANIKVQ